MLSLDLDPQVVASAWERVGGSIFSELGGGQVAHTAINLDLSVVKASLSVQRASSNSPGCTTFSRDLRQPESTNETCTPCSDAATPGTLSCWQSMMQVDLSGSHSHHSGVQQPCTSDGAEILRVPQTVLDVSDTRLYNSIADLQQPKAPATGSEALVEAGAASTDDASDQIVRPQLSRANSLSGVQPDIPGSPLGSSNSGTNSAGSDNSCADLSGSEASAADSTAAAVQETAPTADAALGRTAKAAENKAHLCPKAAMAAATAALQRRLLEQQKMGLLRTPGVPAAVLSVSASAVQPIAQAETQPIQGAVPLGGSASAALPSANVPTAAPKLAGVKGFSAMCWQKPASAATARQLLQHKASVSHAAGVGSVVEPFVRTRAEALARYREKRARRSHAKKIRYHLRKVNADKRPRIKGRFVSKEEMEKMGLLGPSLEAAVDASSVHQQYSAFTGVCDGDHAAAAAAASGCPWEEQMQHTHLMGADMAAELLLRFEDADHEHEHQLLAVADGSPATFEAVLDGSAAHHAAPGHVLLPPVLEYPVECPLATAGDEEMPQLHMDFPAADGLCLGFHDDFLNDEASEVSNHHHALLML